MKGKEMVHPASLPFYLWTLFRATKGQTCREEPDPGPFVSSNGLKGLCEMALFFLVLFRTKPHLHDKRCHFEAACVISAYLSLIPDLLHPPLIYLFLFFLPQ